MLIFSTAFARTSRTAFSIGGTLGTIILATVLGWTMDDKRLLFTILGVGMGIVIISLELWGRVELIGAMIVGFAVVSLILWVAVGQPLVNKQGDAVLSRR
mgnify:CR=1 FL=1